MSIRVGKRIFSLIFIAILAAVAASLGCTHRNLGPLEPIEIPGGPPPGGDGIDKRIMTASVLTIGFHYLEIEFTALMDDTTVNWRVTDEAGKEITAIEDSWAPDGKVLRMRGPFAFCKTYTLIIFAGASDISGLVLKSDLKLTATMGKNPYDVDQTESCTADVVVSPFTSGLDSALLTGDSISDGAAIEQKSHADMTTDDAFYFDGSNYDDADIMVRIPSESGPAALAKLVAWDQYGGNNNLIATNYILNVWDNYDPASETPTTSIYHSISGSSMTKLYGPIVADLNGDGNGDLVVSAEIPKADGSVWQQLFLVEGPVQEGEGLLEDHTSAIFGSSGDELSPPFSVGDLDGDGKDDIAMIHNFISAAGQPYEWTVWILKGNKEINEVVTRPNEMIVHSRAGRMIVDLGSGDFNGDGKSDLLVAELERKYALGGYHGLRPHVNVFFGGDDLNGRRTADPDSDLYLVTAWDTYLNVAGIGDFDGDARDDIAFLVDAKDTRNKTAMTKIYVFAGRDRWYSSYYMTSMNVKHAAVEIDCMNFGIMHLRDNMNDVLAGDVNNDGYYDLMVTADEGVNNTTYWFLGKNSYSVAGWEFTLDQGDITWIFTAQ